MAVRQAVRHHGWPGSAAMAVCHNGRRPVGRAARLCVAALAVGAMAALTFPGTARARYAPVAFVGNENVDLKWGAGGSYSAYIIKRDGQQIARITDPDVGFYRDTAVSKGQTYVYDFCYVSVLQGGQEYLACSDEHRSVTVGDVGGEIYQDLTWNSGVYKIGTKGYVRVWEGATLKIEGSTVEAPSATLYPYSIYSNGRKSGITDYPGGNIQIRGATLPGNVKLIFSAAGQNFLVDSTMSCNRSQYGIEFRAEAEALIRNNAAFGYIYMWGGGSVATISGNVFVGTAQNTAITQYSGEMIIEDNIFTGQIELNPSTRREQLQSLRRRN
ncbi:MAG: hypothetical protein H6Q33_4505 [Deltaproteobacteria bacterium]|nr:hypothetical protein [Deltaproteobacteria bacterium]